MDDDNMCHNFAIIEEEEDITGIPLDVIILDYESGMSSGGSSDREDIEFCADEFYVDECIDLPCEEHDSSDGGDTDDTNSNGIL